MKLNQIKVLVNDLIKKYDTRNPYQLCDYLDIIIQIGDLGDLSGCHLKICDKKFIYLNDRIEDEKMREAVVAHELAHCILHDGYYYFFSYGKQFYSNRVEIEAHTFAAELLIPDEIVFEHPGYTINRLSALTGYGDRLVNFKKI